MKTKNFNVRNMRWNEIEKTNNPNSFRIKRPISNYKLSRGIPFATVIEVTKEEIPNHIIKLLDRSI